MAETSPSFTVTMNDGKSANRNSPSPSRPASSSPGRAASRPSSTPPPPRCCRYTPTTARSSGTCSLSPT
ncbi:MAG: hypothetical protein ACLUE1_03195 [Adlercreutzia equolifaciens]